MSTQSYYKDRLGFDPREALYDGPVKSPRGHSQNSHYNGNNDHYATPPKKHKQQQHHASYQQQHEESPQGGYEDALTQFKGSMSLWEYFVENGDKLGMSVDGVVRKRKEVQTMHGGASLEPPLCGLPAEQSDSEEALRVTLMTVHRKPYTGLEKFF